MTGDQATAVFIAEPIADTIAVICTAILFAVVFTRTIKKLNRLKSQSQDETMATQTDNN